jgi:hypothetical protein
MMTDAEFFASGHTLLKRMIAWGPLKFAAFLGATAVILLLVPARIVGVYSFPWRGENVGFWFEPNWSFVYAIVLPFLFGSFVHMISLMRRALRRLTSEQLHVITKNGKPAKDFEKYISNRLARRARSLMITSTSLAASLTILDFANDVGTVALYRPRMPSHVDWSTMFVVNHAIPAARNLAFDVVAYSAEGLAIFLGFFFILKFWTFLMVFSDSLRHTNVAFEFDPLVHDPEQRLGLGPLGEFMNVYLTLVIVFEFYILGRRLQLIGKGSDFTISTYLGALTSGAQSVANALSNVLNAKFYQWNTIDFGLWLLLICLTLPLIVGAYFPLWTLRRYVARRRNELWDESARAHEDAKRGGKDAEATKLKIRMKQLEHTQLWPNGDMLGWHLMAISVAIGLAAWAPPLCAYLIALAVVFNLGRWLIRVFRPTSA